MYKHRMFGMPARASLVAMAILLGAGALSGIARAQTCPTDLSSLAGQIQTPSLQADASMTIDQIVTAAGGLDQAIASAQQQIATLNAQKSQLPANAPAGPVQMFNDAILIVQTGLNALQCRKGGS
jgi:hypothetical protein